MACAFLAAIEADLDADEPRLSYARHLHGKSDPRGEFIEFQCRLARGDIAHSASPRELRRLACRERALLREHGAAWGPCGESVASVRFARGFAEYVSVWDVRDGAALRAALAPLSFLPTLEFSFPFGEMRALRALGTELPTRVLGLRVTAPLLRGERPNFSRERRSYATF